ncbi:2-oxoacid:acceptor oxidoreductase subunit alpha [bacterium]|nr:2-oxoacid:acceptor oxidoreductase subunit alpha [bacterium]
MDITITISGEAGQGVKTIGSLTARVLFDLGYYVVQEESYHSRVRGGLDATTIRASDVPHHAVRQHIDLFVPLASSVLPYHRPGNGHEAEIGPSTRVLCDGKSGIDLPGVIPVPASERAVALAGDTRAANVFLFGAMCHMLSIPLDVAVAVAHKVLPAKILDKNLPVLAEGYSQQVIKAWSLPQRTLKGQLLANASQAMGAAAIVAGVKFYSGYPMTPGSGIMNYLAAHAQQYGIVVEQAEDEIAAANMAVGASYAGVRQMVSTSGGGFALMVEALSLAAMTETPIVIVDAQRPAPATGLPTRTEQGDLWFVLHAGHGEFVRYVNAPRTAEDAFTLTLKAYDLSSKYQIPAIILSDQQLADTLVTLPRWNLGAVHLDRHLAEPGTYQEPYQRHALTPSGISPRLVPLQTPWPVIIDSDEHDEAGHLSEDLDNRQRMVDKRLSKQRSLLEEMEEPVVLGKGSTLLVGWGSSFGALEELVLDNAADLRLVHFNEVWPLRTERLLAEMASARTVIAVEGNATAQFAQLIERETGRRIDRSVLRFDGRPLTVDYIAGRLHKLEVI